MVHIVLIGLAAGVAAALLLASFASGSLLSIFLFYLAPLPLMIAALGWSHLAGLIAAAVAATALAGWFTGLFFVAFLVGVGLPAWLLSYLALLARPATATESVEWYPVGRLVVWAAVLGALVVAAAPIRHWRSRAFPIRANSSICWWSRSHRPPQPCRRSPASETSGWRRRS
jgi:hypothetical protein